MNPYLDAAERALDAAAAAQSQSSPQSQSGRTYDRGSAVSFETWQRDLAFERTPGAERETIARTRDAREAYDNYVSVWNQSDAETRYSIDQQHGFFGGNLLDPPKPPPPPAPAPSPTKPKPPEPPRDSTNPPPPEVISPPPTASPGGPNPDGPPSTTEGSDQTPETSETTTDQELEDDPNDGTNDPSQDAETNNENDSVLTVRDTTPEDEVVDPATGTRYPTPSDARRAGITNWVYAYDYTGDGG